MEKFIKKMEFDQFRKYYQSSICLSESAAYEKLYEYLTINNRPLEITGKVLKNLPYSFFDHIISDKVVNISKGYLILFNIKYERFQIEIKKIFKSSITKDYLIKDIKSYDLVSDDEIIFTNKRDVAKTLTGALLFGGAGAIAGAITSNSTSSKKYSKKYAFRLFLDDFDLPYVELPCSSREVAFLLLETFKMWEEKIMENRSK